MARVFTCVIAVFISYVEVLDPLSVILFFVNQLFYSFAHYYRMLKHVVVTITVLVLNIHYIDVECR